MKNPSRELISTQLPYPPMTSCPVHVTLEGLHPLMPRPRDPSNREKHLLTRLFAILPADVSAIKIGTLRLTRELCEKSLTVESAREFRTAREKTDISLNWIGRVCEMLDGIRREYGDALVRALATQETIEVPAAALDESDMGGAMGERMILESQVVSAGGRFSYRQAAKEKHRNVKIQTARLLARLPFAKAARTRFLDAIADTLPSSKESA